MFDYGGVEGSLDQARVVHGHFPLSRYRPSLPDVAAVTWLRDPVDRIVSYYSYWQQTEPHGNPTHDRSLAE